MSKLSPNSTENAIRVLVVADYPLVQQSLRVLIESTREISVVGSLSFCAESARAAKASDANVAVLYYSAGARGEIVSELIDEMPGLRVVVIAERSDIDAQAKAIKLGAVGIVHKEQSSKMLIEAIRRTHRGETWMNQVILSKILLNERSGRRKSMNAETAKDPDALTPRELQVTKMIGEGLKNKEIAQKLAITEATVRHHLSSVYSKVGVEDRLNLVITAYQRGLIPLPKQEFKRE